MRLRILSILTLVLLARFVFAQTITKAEYYIDADPGFGKGTPFSITSGDSVVGSFSLNLTGISPGFHTFFNRYQMSTGQWGFSEAMVFFINSNVLDTSVHINGMQYYFDSPASTTTTKFANTDSLNITQLISTAGLAPGVHDVSIRYLYNNGYKGFWESLPFVVQGNVIDTSVHIDKVEYYTDKDNGFGKGTVSSVANLDSVNTTYSISTIGFKPSMHDVFVRYHYTNGQWGFAENSYYFPISGANDTSVHITNVEFFFDKDPGPTFGTSTSISPVDTMTS
ncbi:MAG: hypothetical protein NTX03_09510, partial [Bacteroidetes bacterium]|nr:hypothetical protein [Bacteroidota bacterium]